jgi:tRNA(fMet)-specific endonuclease VapC
MSFLLDMDICSAYLKNDPLVVGKVMLHFGGLSISVVTVGELLTWALRANAPARRLQVVRKFLNGAVIAEINLAMAERFGELRAKLLDQGKPVDEMDLFNAACALVHNLTLVTHNVQDYANIPGLSVVDWMVP